MRTPPNIFYYVSCKNNYKPPPIFLPKIPIIDISSRHKYVDTYELPQAHEKDPIPFEDTHPQKYLIPSSFVVDEEINVFGYNCY